MPSVVEADWQGVREWLTTHAPVTAAILQWPTRADADQLQNRLGIGLPEQWAQWFASAPATDPFVEHPVWPGARLLSADQAVAETVLRRQVYDPATDPATDPWPAQNTDEHPAGDMAWWWHPTFVALTSDGTGDGLFIDLRQGAQQGCVKQWSHEDQGLYPPEWPGPVAMTATLRRALAAGTPLDGWTPTVTDGSLTWTEPDWPIGQWP